MKADISFGPQVFDRRIALIGKDPFKVKCSYRDEVATRQFFSIHFGGNSIQAFPPIKQSFIDRHGHGSYMYLNLDWHPYAPLVPGYPGLYFGSRPKNRVWLDYRLVIRQEARKWLYLGQYDVSPTLSLTKEEWRDTPDKVKNTWATHISKHPWGRFIRVRVTLRNQLHREPTEAEVEAAESNAGDKYQQVPPKQIISAYEKGEETIGVWSMKCVGYHTHFQTFIAENFPKWVPPASHKSAKKGSRKRKQPGSESEDMDQAESDNDKMDTSGSTRPHSIEL